MFLASYPITDRIGIYDVTSYNKRKIQQNVSSRLLAKFVIEDVNQWNSGGFSMVADSVLYPDRDDLFRLFMEEKGMLPETK